MRIFGPVFILETLVASRRWQVIAGRAVFLGLLLACLGSTWQAAAALATSGLALRQQLVRAGYSFYYSMTIVEFLLILMAAPAATAGAICLEKSRGSLAQMLTTELTDREIVLGKLAARLMPVLGLLACALPVSALAVLLGGVDPKALAGALMVAIGLAFLGCSLTMLLSVWGTRPHEVLAVVYTILAAWLLPRFILDLATQQGGSLLARILRPADPFWVAIDSYDPSPGGAGGSILHAVWFLLVALGLSAVLAAAAVRSLRPAMGRMANRKARPVVESRAARRFRLDVPWWPSPSLDRNPVLWREWHRSRPTPWMRAVWGLYLGVSALAGLALVAWNLTRPGAEDPGEISAIFVGLASAFGLLLMSVTSATSLAEERSRGSLDVLLTTPLSTRSIVWGKWRGTFRLTSLVLFWPVVVSYSVVLRILPDARLFVFYVMIPYGVAWAAFVTSLGLALACWTKRLGRALAIAASINVALTIGVPIVLESERWYPASPFFGMGVLASLMESRTAGPQFRNWLASCVAWGGFYALLAGALLAAVGLTFNRALGRAPERPRRPRAEPMRLAVRAGPPTGSGSRTPGAAGRPATSAASSATPPR